MSNQNEEPNMTDSSQSNAGWRSRIAGSKSAGWLAFVALVVIVVVGVFVFG
jgi:hypothetical protein